jgi:hypothetical protein
MLPVQFLSDVVRPVRSRGGGVYSRKDRVLEYAVAEGRKNPVAAADLELGSAETDTLNERDLTKKQVRINSYSNP